MAYWVRLVGSAILALVAFSVCVFGGPRMYGSPITVDTISEVMATDSTNQLLTDSAPQQAAANGWVARDLTEILAYQQLDSRLEILALLAVLEICLIGVTVGIGRTPKNKGGWATQMSPFGYVPQMMPGSGQFQGQGPQQQA